MKIVVASVFLSIFTAVAQNPPPTPAAPGSPTGQATTPPNQGVATNPTGNAAGNQQAVGDPALNAGGRSAFGQPATNQPQIGNAPLFLNVSATAITDVNGQPLGTLQQLALTPSGNVNFGVVNIGGRLVPVPWQLIVTGNAGRPGLAVNADRQVLQRAPGFVTGQLPVLTQDDIQQQILAHFALQAQAQQPPTVVNTGTARGGTGGAGVTITGGATNTASFNTNGIAPASTTNAGSITASNQAVNTTGGLLSPTGRTNVAFDGYNSGPGSTDRFGPRQNTGPATPPPNTPPPNNPAPGQPVGRR